MDREMSFSLDLSSVSFHDELRQARTRLGLSQEAFADQLGFSKKRQQSYESPPDRKHASRPRPAVLKQINVFLRDQLSQLI